MVVVEVATITGGVAGAATLVSSAAVGVAKHIAANHPLVKAERRCWAKDHALEVDQSKQAALHDLVSEHFQLGSKIELCVMVLSAAGLEYEHWFVMCGDWIIEFGSGQGLVRGVWQNSVDVHRNPRLGFYPKKEATITPEMVERMKRVVGATAYSLLLRNCEHIANYIFEGRWLSMQTLTEGRIGKRLLEFVMDEEHRALRNLLPAELRVATVARGEPVYAGLTPRVEYGFTQQVLDLNDSGAYNVVLFGPTGAGKSTLINLIFNKDVADAYDDPDSVTKNMTFYTGEGKVTEVHSSASVMSTAKFVDGDRLGQVRKRINLIDSIGFCDSHLDPDEVYRIIKEQITSNTATLHKVLILTSRRIEAQHKESIKQVMKWLRYDSNATCGSSNVSFLFVYTNMDGIDEDQRATKVAKMCDRLGAATFQRKIVTNEGEIKFVESALAVGLNPKAAFADIKDDYDKLMFHVFDVPTPRGQCGAAHVVRDYVGDERN